MSEIFKVHGLTPSSAAYFISKHMNSGFVIVPSSGEVDQVHAALSHFSGHAFKFPALTHIYEAVKQEPDLLYERIKTQWALVHHKGPSFIVTTREALSQATVSPKHLEKMALHLKKGEWFERDAFIKGLLSIGYRQDELAEDEGFFSVRGLLVDVFTPFHPNPYRVEFFGDEIVSIRAFDQDTQRSLQELNEVHVLPIREIHTAESVWKEARAKIKEFSDSHGFDIDQRDRLFSDIEQSRDISEPRWILPAFEENLVSLNAYVAKMLVIEIDRNVATKDFERSIENERSDFEELTKISYAPEKSRADISWLDSDENHQLSTSIAGPGLKYNVKKLDDLRPKLLKNHSFQPLSAEINEWVSQGMNIEIVLSGNHRKQILEESLLGLSSKLTWSIGPLFEGFASDTFKTVIINERDIFGTRRKRAAGSRSTKDYMRQFSEMNDGDFVIHEDHGIAKYHGLQVMEIRGVKNEFLVLEYAEADKLYLPIYRIDKISRYVQEGYAEPRLDRLGSQLFLKRKARVKKDILELAHELLGVAAERELHQIERHPIDRDAYERFSNEFEYDLTSDQEAAVFEVERDLQKTRPMDRLICGDVGFGKTEVALRAAMLTMLQGKQVVVLAPTTLLVEQHFRNFERRFRHFPIKVSRLSRFVGTSAQKKIVSEIESGQIDLIVGTHRLLQPDVQFKNLGLLIIDEEQRFGVKQKERLKKLRSSIDLISLSATPIPRTLQMSVFEIRDLSLITTPPENRQAVRTSVGTFEESLVKNAVHRELQRGGQVFIVHNRVQTIQGFADKIQKIIPDEKIIVAHGQMNEEDLEARMMEFLDGRARILIATSIIENGLDIPNANTLIVDHSELFGLSSLYQLRGRVGRSHRTSFAYFLIREETVLSAEATKRLQVLQSCTELGAGFAVATHDLEIRGAGNLLGEQQSGVIAEIGLELYTQMLQEIMAEIRQMKPPEPLAEINSGYSAYIPEAYIPDPSVRIMTYKKLDQARELSELLELEDEMLDRFGLYPNEVDNFCQLLRIRLMALPLKPISIDLYAGRFSLLLSAETPLKPEKIIPLLSKEVSIDPKGRISLAFKTNTENVGDDFRLCRDFLQKLLIQ